MRTSLNQGIDIDPNNQTVFITNKHQKGINTSIDANIQKYFGKHNIVSIFERYQMVINDWWVDANPLVYALKGIKG
jgi:hypothetical protein